MSGLVNSSVRICHKKGRIIEEHQDSYTVSIELGDVQQHITVTKDYAERAVIDDAG